MDCGSKTSASGRVFYWNHKQYCISYTIVCREGARKGWWKTIKVCVWGLRGLWCGKWTWIIPPIIGRYTCLNLCIRGRHETPSMMPMTIKWCRLCLFAWRTLEIWRQASFLKRKRGVCLSSTYLTSRCNTRRQRSAMSWKPRDRSFNVWRICSLLLSLSPITWLSAEQRSTPEWVEKKAGRS